MDTADQPDTNCNGFENLDQQYVSIFMVFNGFMVFMVFNLHGFQLIQVTAVSGNLKVDQA